MKSEIWYTARKTYGPDYEVEFSWDKYIEWSKLTHLSELVSLDGLLNGKAKKIQTDLRINNPEEHHADCYLFEVWRHKRIGRKNKKSI